MSSLNQFEKWAKPDLSVNILMFERRLRQNDKRFPKCFKIVFLAVEFCKFWYKVHFQETFVARATARRGGSRIRKWYIQCYVSTYILEVIQGFLIQLHIKPTKVLTKNNYLSQNFLWKNVSPSWNNSPKFQKSVMKIKPEHEQNSKISSRGWRAWKNWFFIKVIFLAPVIFWSLIS